jgi:hypothetical protein
MAHVQISEDLISVSIDDPEPWRKETLQQRYERLKKAYFSKNPKPPAPEDAEKTPVSDR